MSGPPAALVRELLAASLAAWDVTGCVEAADGGAIMIGGTNNNKMIRIEPAPAPAPAPFRWLVTIDGRTRPALSLSAVLRQVRSALDPGYAAMRVRVAVAPLVPS